MSHHASAADHVFRSDFIAGRITPAQFNHRAHVRLAYVLLTEASVDEAAGQMRSALHAFLAHHGIDVAKYHETITQAWIQAVRHFMDRTAQRVSADEFVGVDPAQLEAEMRR